MTKKELAIQISTETGISQLEVADVIQRTLDHIHKALVAGDHIEFRDFGVFEVTRRKARIGRNPNQPANTVQIPERKVVKFKPGKKMKEEVLLS